MYSICKIGAALGLFKCQKKHSAEIEAKFYDHVSKFGLSYGTTEEFRFRLNEFAEKDAAIEKINAKQSSYTVGHNQFSTWTKGEYKQLLGYRGQENQTSKYTVLDASNLSSTVDWRSEGAVNPVKNQGQCGSCWAFSATSSIEGAYFIKNNYLENFSEQELVDCDKVSLGCQGGLQSNAMTYLETHGQELTMDYPYTAQDGTCKFDMLKAGVKVKSINNVTPQSIDQLKAAIQKGPTAVTVEADTYDFQMYTGGILNSTDCGTQLDHAITAVGYGTDGGQDYYIVRNSWGASWGDSGYIKIAAVPGLGICGIQQVSLYPSL